MVIQLIDGKFSTGEAVEMLTRMIQVKIHYHESKIAADNNEEDIKYRETKIKSLQKELSGLKESALAKNDSLLLDAVINIS